MSHLNLFSNGIRLSEEVFFYSIDNDYYYYLQMQKYY